jgi:CDP-glycerol glycerophosphotransferase (TagB/SpsB family)
MNWLSGQIWPVTLQIGSARSSYDHNWMTSLQRLAAVHKQNEVSWHCKVSNKAHRTLQASTSKQLHHKSATLISIGNTSLNKLQHIDPVKYCVQNYSVHKTGKAAGCCLLPYWSETPLCYSFIYNITSAQASTTILSAMHNKFPILYSLHDHIYGMPLSQ